MRFLSFLGKLLISVGVGVLLFVVWTLWGTGIYTEQQQERLAREFDQMPAFHREGGPSEKEVEGPPKGFAPAPGRPVFELRIPKIDISKIVVEGVGTDELALGPGHYPSCRPGFERPLCTDWPEAWPGEKGRVIVSGHRTTHGQPFYRLNELEKGDHIITETQWGTFTYTVTRTEIVPANSLAIVIQKDDVKEIALTTCNPRYSAAERLIVFGELEEAAA